MNILIFEIKILSINSVLRRLMNDNLSELDSRCVRRIKRKTDYATLWHSSNNRVIADEYSLRQIIRLYISNITLVYVTTQLQFPSDVTW